MHFKHHFFLEFSTFFFDGFPKVVLTSVISIHDQLSTILHETAGVQNPSLWNVENLFPLTDREMKMSIVILVEIADQDLQESMKITVFHTDE